MKNILLSSLAVFFNLAFCYSQDVITLKSGGDIVAKVYEVSQTEIKYRKFDNLSGPVYTILKSDVLMIRYENGTKDIFSEEKINENVPPVTYGRSDLYLKGQADAFRYYKGYKGAGTATLMTSLLSPLIGLIPAIACSSTPPKDINLNYPNAELMKKQDYYNGYTQRAKKIKQGKVWTNFGIAFGVNVVVIILISSGQ